MVGALLFVLIVVIMQSFVWTIEVNGITTISESEFLETLKEEGLHYGTFKGKADLPLLQRNVMKRIEEIGWMSVNIIGTKAEVEIKEKEIKPHIIEADVPCNIKAERDGVIIGMNTKYGEAVVSPGSAVIEGSLLVSGVLENPSGDVSFVHADAEVIAQTHRSFRFSVIKSGQVYIPFECVKRYKLRCFALEVPLSFESVRNVNTSRVYSQNIMLNDTLMPFGLITEECTAYESVSFVYDEQTALRVLSIEDYLYRLFTLSDCSQIDADITFSESDSEYIANVLYECKEDIATEENIIVNR